MTTVNANKDTVAPKSCTVTYAADMHNIEVSFTEGHTWTRRDVDACRLAMIRHLSQTYAKMRMEATHGSESE